MHVDLLSARNLLTSLIPLETASVPEPLAPLSVGAPGALPDTDLVATLNGRLVDRYADDPALAVVAAPVELEPFHYFLIWHPRLDHDPAQQWLRDTIRSVAAASVGGPSGSAGL